MHPGKHPKLPHVDPDVKWCSTRPGRVIDADTLSSPPCELYDRRDLNKAMDIVESASGDELRAVVLALCKDTSVMLRAVEHIKKLRDAQASTSKTGEKRKAPDQFFICVRCGETFSEEANDSKACTYHHGKWEMEVRDEEDFWADHDEDCHGLIDTEEMREEYPEGFTWDCCNQIGTAPGCTKGHHYAIEGKRMKTTTDEGSVSDFSDD